ncbi:MAG: ATP-binding protein [Candidatus Omnitrophica bacterium]|nr:ATP-binding protein [Candidatus Omnitrophota bacterium]
MKPTSIKNKILSSQLTIVFLAMFSLGMASYFLIFNFIHTSQKKAIENFAKFDAEEVENYFVQTKALLERIANSREFEDFHTTFRYLLLVKHFVKFNQVFPVISYVNMEGREEVRVENSSAHEDNLKNYSKNPAFQESLREHNKIIISSPELDSELGELAIRLFFSRYAYFGDEFIGTLAVTIPVSRIGDVEKDKIGKTGLVFLIDNNGIILTYPQKEKIFTPLIGRGTEIQRLLLDCRNLKAGSLRVNLFGRDSFVVYAPLKETGWSLLAILPYQEFMEPINDLQKLAAVIFIIVLIFSVIVSLKLTRSIIGPISNLASVTNFIAKGNFSKRVDVFSEDEVGQLALAFNAMVENLEKTTVSRDELLKEVTERKKAEDELKKAYIDLKEAQDQLIQAEKLNAVGQLASGVAHEVRNPLGIILQGINYLEKKMSPDKKNETAEIMAMLKGSVQRADKIIAALLDFSRAASSDLKLEDINSILESSLNLVKARFKFDNIDVVTEIKEGLPMVLADKNKLEQVFINILLNAAQAMPGGGKITIRSYAKELKETRDGIGKREEDHFRIGEKAVIVEIEDCGNGISEENLKKIFDPFFTTKGPGSGVGLGLSVTRNIIHMHKGLIYAESQLGKGTKVIIILKIKG